MRLIKQTYILPGSGHSRGRARCLFERREQQQRSGVQRAAARGVDHHDRRGADARRGRHLHRPGRRLLRPAGAEGQDRADQRRRVRDGRPADRQGPARRGQLRLVHPRPDRGQIRGARPDESRRTLPAKPINMRIIADTSQMQPGNQALYVMPNSPYKTVQDLVKDHAESASTRCTTSHRCCSARCSPRTDYGVNALKQVRADPSRSCRQLLANAQDRRRLAARAVRHARPSRSTARCNWPTSTRARCRTSRSARSSAARRGCSPTRIRSRRSCARSRRASRSRTPTGAPWRRHWSRTRWRRRRRSPQR